MLMLAHLYLTLVINAFDCTHAFLVRYLVIQLDLEFLLFEQVCGFLLQLRAFLVYFPEISAVGTFVYAVKAFPLLSLCILICIRCTSLFLQYKVYELYKMCHLLW